MITGSRNLLDQSRFDASLTSHLAALRHQLGDDPVITVIDGDAAEGADRFSKLYCEKHGTPRLPYPANWADIDALGAHVKKNRRGEFYNARAGFDRNCVLAEHCDSGLAFWDGDSPGTKHAIEQLRKRGKPVLVVRHG